MVQDLIKFLKVYKNKQLIFALILQTCKLMFVNLAHAISFHFRFVLFSSSINIINVRQLFVCSYSQANPIVVCSRNAHLL